MGNNKKLIEYIMSHNRRLISPVGSGSNEKFNDQVNSSNMKPEEKIARWMYFQTKEYGHDFVQSTIPYAEMCRNLGLKTYFSSNEMEYVYPGQIKDKSDLKKIQDAKLIKNLMLSPHILAIKEFKKLSGTPVGGGCFGPLTLLSCVMGLENFLKKCIKDPVWVEDVSIFFAELMMEIAFTCESYGADFFFGGRPSSGYAFCKTFQTVFRKIYRRCFQRYFHTGIFTCSRRY